MEYAAIAGMCGIVLTILFLRTKTKFLLGVAVRTIMGAGAILFVNEFLKKQGIALEIGVNPLTLLTAGSLGFPGVALLYAIEATKFL